MTVPSTTSPTVSRAVVGPNSGSTRYGPAGVPKRYSVPPKSVGCDSRPISFATSNMPATPTVVFTQKRTNVLPARSGLN